MDNHIKAMAKDSIKAAIIVSSITFGIGHIVNLFNGSSDDPIATIIPLIYVIILNKTLPRRETNEKVF